MGSASLVERDVRALGGAGVDLAGRPIFVFGLSIISFQCAIQPGSRPIAKRTVKIWVGKPIAR